MAVAVVDELRRLVEAAMGTLSPAKAQELAKQLMQGEGKDQISKTAKDLVAWSKQNRERVTGLVRTEVRSQMKQLGVASQDEVEALRKRVRELEKSRPRAKTSRAKKTTVRRSRVKQPGATAPAPASDTSVPVTSVPITTSATS